jgi:hypothetical protein
MSLFRYTRDEYDNMYIRYPDNLVQYLISHLRGEAFLRIYEYVNCDGTLYTLKEVRTIFGLISQYFFIFGRNQEILCRDVNNNISSLNEIVIQFFNPRRWGWRK